jgi:hypothetical protein
LGNGWGDAAARKRRTFETQIGFSVFVVAASGEPDADAGDRVRSGEKNFWGLDFVRPNVVLSAEFPK